MMDLSWYVIQTKPWREEQAGHYLLAKGIEIFSPQMESISDKCGKVRKDLKPLFPTYIFGHFDVMRNYALVKWGRGVRKIIGFGEGPIPVSPEVIEELKKRSDPQGIVRITHRFHPNDRVRIKTGPFQDFLGIFEGWVSGQERVRILLNLIQYQAKIEVPCGLVEKVQ